MGTYLTHPTAIRWLAIITTALALLLTMAGVLLADGPRREGCPCLADRVPESQASPALKRAAADYRQALDRAAANYRQAVLVARQAYQHDLKQIEADERTAIQAEIARLKNLPAPQVEPEPTADTEGDAMNRRTITVELQAPNPLWSVAIREVRRVDDELWVLSELNKQHGMAAMVISTVSDQVTVEAPDDLPVRHYTIGRTWQWDNDDAITFIDDLDELSKPWHQAPRLMIQPRNK